MLQTKKYLAVHVTDSQVLDITQNLPLMLTLMTFAKKQTLN